MTAPLPNLGDVAAFEAIFAVVTEFVARVSASTITSGRPPTETPVIAPDPLILTGFRFSTP